MTQFRRPEVLPIGADELGGREYSEKYIAPIWAETQTKVNPLAAEGVRDLIGLLGLGGNQEPEVNVYRNYDFGNQPHLREGFASAGLIFSAHAIVEAFYFAHAAAALNLACIAAGSKRVRGLGSASLAFTQSSFSGGEFSAFGAVTLALSPLGVARLVRGSTAAATLSTQVAASSARVKTVSGVASLALSTSGVPTRVQRSSASASFTTTVSAAARKLRLGTATATIALSPAATARRVQKVAAGVTLALTPAATGQKVSLILGSVPTTFGAFTNMANAFDGSRALGFASCAQATVAGVNVSAHIGKNYASGHKISHAIISGSSNFGYTNFAGTPDVSVWIIGNTATPTSTIDGTLLASLTFVDGSVTATKQLNNLVDQTTAFTWVWALVFRSSGAAGSTTLAIAELEFYEIT